ncbi:integral membrane protein, CcrB [Companilactobacillus versmoldensis DSM 14857 = KCTC 3814]|uniref:Fluoride-specific ion channel FluC n=2 Tax=Companilactobacillus versmoldensis TaxID=194326 RepID=A0A0R1S9M5_9LACO|nr:integral membrane protein, CcrB [Companilactobacillus versmoldensis DSM 14857 = KCTC 3814]
MVIILKGIFKMNVVLVALGATLGAYLRNELTVASRKVKLDFPWMTFLINAVGAFLLGVVTAKIGNKAILLFLGTGMCGGFTTFGTFNFELSQLWFQHRYVRCFIYFCLSYIFGILGFALGIQL